MRLRQAYEKNDIKQIQQILQDKSTDIFNDVEVNQYLDDLLRNIRLNVLEQKVLPYKSVNMEYLAKEIKISVREIR